MEVRDPDGLAGEGVMDEIRTAIADFAVATGREGVCVPAVDVVGPLTHREAPVCGDYSGPRWSIRVSAERDCVSQQTVTHELCHAIDTMEGLSDAHPDEFPGDEVDTAVYEEEIRATEDFAQACEDGPQTYELDAAWDDACGDPVLDAGDRFVQENVYVDASRLTVENTGVALDIVDRSLPLDAETQVLDATGADGELWLTAWHYVGEQRSTQLLRLDPVTGEVLGDIELAPLSDDAPAASFAVSDSDPIVLVHRERESGPDAWEVERVHPASGWVERLGTTHEASLGAAWSEGVLYIAGYDPEDDTSNLWTWSPGERGELDAPQWVHAIRPAPGGVEVQAGEGLWRYDRELGTWSSVPLLGPWEGFARWSGTLRIFLAPRAQAPSGGGFEFSGDEERGLVLLDTETGVVELPQDPCAKVGGGRHWWVELGEQVVLVWWGVPFGSVLTMTVISPAGR